MRYSKHDILPVVRELSRWISDGATADNQNFLYQTMNYILHARNRGLILQPSLRIEDPRSGDFVIKGKVNSNYATNAETIKSANGSHVNLNGAPVVMRSIGQNIISLPAIES